MFVFIKTIFIGFLSFTGSSAILDNTANFKTYISLNKQQCITQPSLINLLPN